MSGVAQRAGQVDIGAAAAVSRWESAGRTDYASGISVSPPATMSGQYGRSSTATNGSPHMAAFAWLGRFCRMGLTTWHDAVVSYQSVLQEQLLDVAVAQRIPQIPEISLVSGRCHVR